MKSRTLLLVLLVLTLCAAVPRAETVAGLPLHVQELGEGVIRLWVGDQISSTAVVAFATAQGILVVDTTGIPEVDRELRRVIARRFGRDDFTTLINTHEHGDHTGGNAVYADCEIVGHELVGPGMTRGNADRARIADWLTTRVAELEAQIAGLAQDAPETARLREDLILNRLELAVARDDAAPAPPTRTFADRLVLDRGDMTFQLYSIGGMHTASDIAILVPERGLLLTGDTMADVWLTETPGCLASFIARPGVAHDFPKLLRNWNALLERGDEIDRYVPGHWNGELTAAGFAARVKYVEALWHGVNAAAADGADLLTVLDDNRLGERFPELVDSPGCSAGNNYTTIVEMWTAATGQRSAARELYRLLDEDGAGADIHGVLARFGDPASSYFFLEAELNAHGYRLLQQGKLPEAEALFRCNTECFPDSWNCWDSLAESLLAAGDREGAIAMYEKSLELNPESTSGRDALARIRAAATVN